MPPCPTSLAAATEEERGREGVVATLKGTVHIIFFSLTSLNLAFNYVLMMLAAFCRLEFTAVSLNLITSIMASSGIANTRERGSQQDKGPCPGQESPNT